MYEYVYLYIIISIGRVIFSEWLQLFGNNVNNRLISTTQNACSFIYKQCISKIKLGLDFWLSKDDASRRYYGHCSATIIICVTYDVLKCWPLVTRSHIPIPNLSPTAAQSQLNPQPHPHPQHHLPPHPQAHPQVPPHPPAHPQTHPQAHPHVDPQAHPQVYPRHIPWPIPSHNTSLIFSTIPSYISCPFV